MDKYCSEQRADLNLALKASHVKCDNNPIRYEQQQSFDPMHYPWIIPSGSGMKSDPSGVIKGNITFF